MQKRKIKQIITFFLITSVLLSFPSKTKELWAEPVVSSNVSDVMISKYEVSNQKIIPGQDFTLTITVMNYSANVIADGVKIAIQNPEGIAPVYGTVSQGYIGTLMPGESKDISFNYNSWTTIVTDTIDFNVLLSASTSDNEVILRVPSSLDAPFKIDTVTIPEETVTGQKTDINLTFSVLGVENVSNIVMSLEGDDFQTAKSNIGILSPGVTKSQNTSITFDNPGNYPVNVYLSYTNSDGTTKKIKVYSSNIIVTQGTVETLIPDVNEQSKQLVDNSINKILVIGVSGILIIVVFGLILLLIYKKK